MLPLTPPLSPPLSTTESSAHSAQLLWWELHNGKRTVHPQKKMIFPLVSEFVVSMPCSLQSNLLHVSVHETVGPFAVSATRFRLRSRTSESAEHDPSPWRREVPDRSSRTGTPRFFRSSDKGRALALLLYPYPSVIIRFEDVQLTLIYVAHRLSCTE